MKSGLIAIAAMALVAGCAGRTQLVGSPEVAVVNFRDLPPPNAELGGASSGGYAIGPLDRLIVTVVGLEEFSGKVQADASGGISVPLAGYIKAAGKSPGELADEIAARLREKHVRDPIVSVNLEEVVSRTVTVDGEVIQPGIYPVLPNMTLSGAIASAKGAGKFARLDEVVVFRTVGERRLAALYSLRAIRAGIYADPTIYPNDVVVVGDSPSRRLFDTLIQGAPLFTTPLIIALQNR